MIHIKIQKDLHHTMLQDIKRLHPFAYERVGFLFVRKGTTTNDNYSLLATEYQSIPDLFYINDPDVGAKINSAAIRSAMERAMANGCGIIHVHIHHEDYSSAFSRTDRREFMRLIPSFHNIGGEKIHGAVVFSGNRFTGFVLIQKNGPPVEVSRITIIGYPVIDYVQERSRPWRTIDIVDKAF